MVTGILAIAAGKQQSSPGLITGMMTVAIFSAIFAFILMCISSATVQKERETEDPSLDFWGFYYHSTEWTAADKVMTAIFK